MIPYFEQPSFSLGPVTIHAFGVLVAVGIFDRNAPDSAPSRSLGHRPGHG